MKKIILVFLLLSLAITASCGTENNAYTAQIVAMDTMAAIKVYDNKYADIADECAELMLELEAELSVTLTGSRVYHLNKNGTVPSTDNLKALVALSNELSDATDGAFNSCIYPLVKLWGFTTDNEPTVPTLDAIEEALEVVNNSKLAVDGENITVSNNGAVDFGGIAKGYAARLMRDKLKASGVKSALIDLGGNIQTVGKKLNGEKWNIAVNNPNGDGYIGILSVDEAAVVTSGSDSRYFIADGKKYHHIIDPHTGCPVINGLSSVTVVCENSDVADALATACFVVGVDKSLPVLKKYNAEAVFVTEVSVSLTKGLENKFTLDKTIEGEYSVNVID